MHLTSQNAIVIQGLPRGPGRAGRLRWLPGAARCRRPRRGHHRRVQPTRPVNGHNRPALPRMRPDPHRPTGSLDPLDHHIRQVRQDNPNTIMITTRRTSPQLGDQEVRNDTPPGPTPSRKVGQIQFSRAAVIPLGRLVDGPPRVPFHHKPWLTSSRHDVTNGGQDCDRMLTSSFREPPVAQRCTS